MKSYLKKPLTKVQVVKRLDKSGRLKVLLAVPFAEVVRQAGVDAFNDYVEKRVLDADAPMSLEDVTYTAVGVLSTKGTGVNRVLVEVSARVGSWADDEPDTQVEPPEPPTPTPADVLAAAAGAFSPATPDAVEASPTFNPAQP